MALCYRVVTSDVRERQPVKIWKKAATWCHRPRFLLFLLQPFNKLEATSLDLAKSLLFLLLLSSPKGKEGEGG
jgi:hypothetical protein